MAAADTSWQSMLLEGRAWEDRLAARRHRRQTAPTASRAAARRSAEAGRERLLQPGTVPLGEREGLFRLWRAGEVLARSEFEIGRETVTVVVQGPRWWRWSPSLGASSGAASTRPARVMLGPAAVLLAAGELASELELVDAGRSEVAGRAAFLVRGRPAATGSRRRTVLREAGLGAEVYELRVDAERGVLLGVSSIAAGRPFQVVEATAVRFDDELSPTVFSPPGEQQARFAAPAPRQVSLDELPANLPFTVVVPAPSPSPFDPHVALLPDEQGGSRVLITYAVSSGGRRGQLRLQLTAHEPAPGRADRWQAAEDVITSEQQVHGIVRRRARTFRAGTFAELESSVLDLGQLVELARSLVPLAPA